MISRTAKVILSLALAVSILSISNVAYAADARNFNPGRIIDDAVFTNSDSMSVDAIQRFLNSKVTCDTWGTKRSELGGGTRAQWMSAHGYSAPFRCINDYMENPATGENNYGRTDAPQGSVSAAQLIYNYSKQFNINPQTLIVTLQKENGLITDEWPTLKQYREAMGFGCPDNVAPGAPACDPSYGSFSAQLYQAARHFRGYIDKPAGWYVTFNTGANTILWNPNSSCGSSSVNIENRATVALYTYTPYRPNQAALNAQYGTGDGCSAYGNRNFYMYFTDWFGSTTLNSNLLRTVDNATVYVVGDGYKYPISSMDIFGALSSALGGVGFVSQSYLDSYQTGQVANRLIRSPDGSIYFYDSAIKLPFTSCTLVADYGFPCGGAMQLTQPQIDKFVNGPLVTRGMNTTDGHTYYIESGVKREIFDEQSLLDEGRTTGFNVLSSQAFNYLPYGAPVVRGQVIVRARESGERFLYDKGSLKTVANSDIARQALSNISQRDLDSASVDKMTKSGERVGDLIKDDSNNVYLLTTEGKKTLSGYQADTAKAITLSTSLVSSIPGNGNTSTPALIKSLDNGTVYVLINGQKRPLVAMEDLKSITGQDSPYIAWADNDYVNSIPTGNIIIGAGRLVKTPSNATVYMTDGYDKLVPMSTFDPASDMGLQLGIRTISDDILSKYSLDNTVLSSYVSCGGISYITIGGSLYPTTLSGKTPRTLQVQTCNVLTKKPTLPGFLIAPYGTIYQLKNGTIYPITSWAKYVSLSTSGGTTVNATYSTLSLFPVGSAL